MNPINFSTLKYIAQSPRHYQHALTTPVEPNAAMRIGTAVHYRVLGGTPYQVFSGTRRGKAWDEFEASSGGALILNAREAETAEKAAFSVLMGNLDAERLLSTCQKETPFDWTFCGRACHTRGVDFHSDTVFGELKVSMTANPEKFWAHASKQGWFAQLAWYEEALRFVGGDHKRTAYIIAVEPKAPYLSTVFQVREADLEQGRRQIRGWMERLLQCEADDHWPGYAERIIELQPPAWALDAVDEDEDESEGDE